MRSLVHWLLIAIVFIATAITFQNCNRFEWVGDKYSSQASSPGPSPQPDPAPSTSPPPPPASPDLVEYNPAGTQTTTQETSTFAWGCIQTMQPTNITNPIVYEGLTLPITVVSGGCGANPNYNRLDPIQAGADLRFFTVRGIYALRFKTPTTPGQLQITFLAYGGGYWGGDRHSVSRLPGEFKDGVANSSYCDVTFDHVFTWGPPDPKRPCQLEMDKYYYFNAMMKGPDPDTTDLGTSLFSW